MRKSLTLLGALAVFCHFAVGGAPTLYGAIVAYEGFDYEVAELGGQAGGFGFAGPWERTMDGAEEGAVFDVSLDGVSLQTPIFPSTPSGGRVHIAGAGGSGGNNTRVVRTLANPFSLVEDGVLYASFMMQKDVSAPPSANNLEFNLGPGNLVRFGSTSNDQWFLSASNSPFGSVQLSTTYFIVLKLEAFAEQNHVRSVMIFDPERAVPLDEPAVWDQFNNFSTANTEISVVQLWVGRQAAGQFDEVRIGETWHDVTHAVPEFPPPPTAGDFNGDGNVDGADFVIWQTNFPNNSGTATLGMGDANGDGNVDGADFVVWQTNFPTTSGGLTPVPEPGSLVLTVFGLVGLVVARRRTAGRALD